MSTLWQRATGLSILALCLATQGAAADPLSNLSSDDQAVIQLLLEHQPSDAPRPLPSGNMMTITRTETNPRICRWFTISGPSGSGTATGCREGPRQWSLSNAAGGPVASAPVAQAPVTQAPVVQAPVPPQPVVAAAPAPAAPTVSVAPAPGTAAPVVAAAAATGPLAGGPLPTVIRPQGAVPTTPLPGSGAAGPPMALGPQLPPAIISTAAVAEPQVAALPPAQAPIDVSAIPMPPIPPMRQGDIAAGRLVEAPPIEPPRPTRRPVDPAAADNDAPIVPPPLPSHRPDRDTLVAAAPEPAPAVEVAAATLEGTNDADEPLVRLVPAPEVPRPVRHPRDVAAAWRDSVTMLAQAPEVPLPAHSPVEPTLARTTPVRTTLSFADAPSGETVAVAVAVNGDVAISALSFADDDGAPLIQGSADEIDDEVAAEFLSPRPDVPLPGRHPSVAGGVAVERLDPAPDIPLPPRRPTTAG